MNRFAGKIGGLALLVWLVLSTGTDAGWGGKPGRGQGTTATTNRGGVVGQAVRIAPRLPGVPGIPGMQIKGMPHVPGMPGLPGVTSLPGLIGKLR